MASFKSHPFFYTSLLLIGAVTAGEAWLVFSQRSQTTKLGREIEQKQQDLSAFARQNPFPSRENVAQVEADLAEAEKTRADIRGILRATSETATKLASATAPASSTDAYFDIANYVERVRADAQKAEIRLPAENRLGFSVYSSTGPDRELIEPVFRQRQYADYLMNVLIKAHPREIVSMQRERPLTAAQKQQLADAGASAQAPSTSQSGTEGSDYFTIDPRVSARVAGFVETMPFRFSFTGTTGSLRVVLNELARFELPVVVRSVEVEPLAKTDSHSSVPAPAATPFALFGGDPATGAAANAAEQEKPLIEQTDSRFVVTVEFISLVDKNNPAGSATPTH